MPKIEKYCGKRYKDGFSNSILTTTIDADSIRDTLYIEQTNVRGMVALQGLYEIDLMIAALTKAREVYLNA